MFVPSRDRKEAVFAHETGPLPYGRGSEKDFSHTFLATAENWPAIGIAVDPVGRKIYWGEFFTIRCANLDGTEPQDLVTGLSVFNVPAELELDLDAGKLYWVGNAFDVGGIGRIQRSNLDGTEVKDLITEGFNFPEGLALDLPNGKVYWTDKWYRRIRRANLDGTEVEDLVTDPPGFGLMGIALDLQHGKMYWAGSGALFVSVVGIQPPAD